MHPVKHMLRVLPAILLMLMMCAVPAFADDSFTFELNGDTATLTGYSGSDTAVTVPGYYLCKPVTAIGAGVFEGRAITSVALPDTIVRIGSGSFRNCTQLSEITTYKATMAHAWDDGVTTAPTCAAEGSTVYTCTICGSTKTETIAALPHTEVIDEAVAATCTSTGLTEGSHCSVCEAIITAQEVLPLLDHSPEVIPAVPATCTSTGLTEGSKCSVCQTVLVEQTEIPMADHSPEVIPAVPATCTSTGLTEGSKCSVCQTVLVEQTETPMADHSPEVIPAVPATCTSTGLTEGSKCSVCQTMLVEQTEIPMADHSWDEGVITTPPTATEDGVKTFTCTVCSATRTEPIPATGEEPEPEVLRGDVNGDGKVSLSDLMRLVKYLNRDLTIDDINDKGADVNGDGKISLADLMRLVKILNHDV